MLNDELLQEIFTQLEDEQNKEIKQVGSFEYTWYKKKSLKDAILKIFQTIHCNEHYPQNHNLYTGNKNPYSGFSLVKNGIWKETNDVNELRDIFLRCKERLIELIQCNIEFNDEYIQKILHDQIKNLGLNFENHNWILPHIYKWFKEQGDMSFEEMLKVFNCGLGMIIICRPNKQKLVIKKLKNKKEPFFLLGKVVKNKGKIDINYLKKTWKC